MRAPKAQQQTVCAAACDRAVVAIGFLAVRSRPYVARFFFRLVLPAPRCGGRREVRAKGGGALDRRGPQILETEQNERNMDTGRR